MIQFNTIQFKTNDNDDTVKSSSIKITELIKHNKFNLTDSCDYPEFQTSQQL